MFRNASCQHVAAEIPLAKFVFRNFACQNVVCKIFITQQNVGCRNAPESLSTLTGSCALTCTCDFMKCVEQVNISGFSEGFKSIELVITLYHGLLNYQFCKQTVQVGIIFCVYR